MTEPRTTAPVDPSDIAVEPTDIARWTESSPIPMLIVQIDGHSSDRFVAAFPDGDCYVVPVDRERPANRLLLEADEVVVASATGTVALRVESCRPATPAQIAVLEGIVGRPLSVTTEVIVLVGLPVGRDA